MKTVTVHLQSISAYSQSRGHKSPKLNAKESAAAYDDRTWREKCTCNAAGDVVIPAMALKMALDTVASRLGEKTKGAATLTKHFIGGVVCESDVPIGHRKDDAPRIDLFLHTTGIPGSGKRAWKAFPQWDKWEAVATFAIIDDVITKDAFERHVKEAGRFVGIGRWRPQQGGLNGRFAATKFEWAEV